MTTLKQKTVRELAGEIYAEILQAQIDGNKKQLQSIKADDITKLVDLIMGVLARHIEVQITNDNDFPVKPLSRKKLSNK